MARKSIPSRCMSIGACGASCAASTSRRAPWSCATRAISASGQISPVTLLAPVTATSVRVIAVGQVRERVGEGLEQRRATRAPGGS